MMHSPFKAISMSRGVELVDTIVLVSLLDVLPLEKEEALCLHIDSIDHLHLLVGGIKCCVVDTKERIVDVVSLPLLIAVTGTINQEVFHGTRLELELEVSCHLVEPLVNVAACFLQEQTKRLSRRRKGKGRKRRRKRRRKKKNLDEFGELFFILSIKKHVVNVEPCHLPIEFDFH